MLNGIHEKTIREAREAYNAEVAPVKEGPDVKAAAVDAAQSKWCADWAADLLDAADAAVETVKAYAAKHGAP